MNEIANYYDEFHISSIINYRVLGNKRIDKIKGLIDDYLKDKRNEKINILEIGCGIGVITEYVAKKYPLCHAIGIDLSGKAIDYAKKSVKLSNIAFIEGDVINGQRSLDEAIGARKFDILILPDVIEHLPKEKHHVVFNYLAKLISSQAVIFITYPNPEYTHWLLYNRPSLLQPIDEVIGIDDIMKICAMLGTQIILYKKTNISLKQDYNHVVLARYEWQYETLQNQDINYFSKLLRLFVQLYNIWNYIYLPFRDLSLVRKSVTGCFGPLFSKMDLFIQAIQGKSR